MTTKNKTDILMPIKKKECIKWTRFSVNGYNEDADTYVPYGLFGTYIEAKTHLNTLLPLLRKGLLTDRRTKEPIDWLNIVENNKILASFT